MADNIGHRLLSTGKIKDRPGYNKYVSCGRDYVKKKQCDSGAVKYEMYLTELKTTQKMCNVNFFP